MKPSILTLSGMPLSSSVFVVSKTLSCRTSPMSLSPLAPSLLPSRFQREICEKRVHPILARPFCTCMSLCCVCVRESLSQLAPRFSGCTEENASTFITPAQRSAIVWDSLQQAPYEKGEGRYGGWGHVWRGLLQWVGSCYHIWRGLLQWMGSCDLIWHWSVTVGVVMLIYMALRCSAINTHSEIVCK